jgi:hypothetical protein
LTLSSSRRGEAGQFRGFSLLFAAKFSYLAPKIDPSCDTFVRDILNTLCHSTWRRENPDSAVAGATVAGPFPQGPEPAEGLSEAGGKEGRPGKDLEMEESQLSTVLPTLLNHSREILKTQRPDKNPTSDMQNYIFRSLRPIDHFQSAMLSLRLRAIRSDSVRFKHLTFIDTHSNSRGKTAQSGNGVSPLIVPNPQQTSSITLRFTRNYSNRPGSSLQSRHDHLDLP